MTDLVDREVFDEYELVRRSGLTNMFSISTVKSIALKLGFRKLSNLASDKTKYADFLKNYGTYADKWKED